MVARDQPSNPLGSSCGSNEHSRSNFDWSVSTTYAKDILTRCPVSDTAFKDASADISGPAIKQILLDRGFECTSIQIVPDDESRIQEFVKSVTHGQGVDFVITSGGTGFGVRDRTPEVSSFKLFFQPVILTYIHKGNITPPRKTCDRPGSSHAIYVPPAHAICSPLPSRRRYNRKDIDHNSPRERQSGQREYGSVVIGGCGRTCD
jgi:hypothetical protein